MRLYLVQHGAAASKDVDPERPLTEEGRQTVEEAAGFLAFRSIRPGRIEHSGKLRALETAEILAAYLEPSDGTHEVEGIAPMDDIAPTTERLAASIMDVMIVGHLPHLSRLATRLLGGEHEDDAVVSFQMGGVVCLERDESAHWAVAWMLVPELLK